MQEKSFDEIFSADLIKNTLLVDEKLGQNCDFLLLELCKHFNYSIFQWNDNENYLKKAFSKYNVFPTINDCRNEYKNEDILDDIYTMKTLGFDHKGKVGIFRSGTATVKDYYDYDVVVVIEKLKSGCTNKIDGNIKVIQRDNVILECKYKVYTDRIGYFN